MFLGDFEWNKWDFFVWLNGYGYVFPNASGVVCKSGF